MSRAGVGAVLTNEGGTMRVYFEPHMEKRINGWWYMLVISNSKANAYHQTGWSKLHTHDLGIAEASVIRQLNALAKAMDLHRVP